MDNQAIVSLMGTTSTKGGSARQASDKGDADAFSAAMNDAVRGKEKKDGDNLIADEKAEEKAAKAKDKKGEGKDVPADAKATGKVADQKAVGRLQNYLHHLVYKDPSTMSVADRQALRVGEFAQEKVGLTELQKMLMGRGLNIRDLSFSQLALLTSRNSRPQINGQLESMLRESQLEAGKNPLGGAEVSAASAQNQQSQSLDQLLVQEAAATRETSKSNEADRQQQRQAVIDQILQHIEVKNLANRTELHLRLNPEYLGEVKIKLSHSQDGGVNASFETTSRTTRELLEESEDEIISQVQSRGIRLGKLDVTLVEEVA